MSPPHRVALFLRGINLGSRRLKKEELMRPFRDAGFEGVDTFIASGNVVIDDPGMEADELERRVEAAVASAFGFESDAFARRLPMLADLVEGDVLQQAEAEGFTPHVIFLKAAPSPEACEAVAQLEGEGDRFPIFGREMLWMRRGRLSDSLVEARHLEGALGGVPNTMRKVTTLRRMVAKYGV